MTTYIAKTRKARDDDIDWGTLTDQVGAIDIPIDAQSTFTLDDLFKRTYGPTIYPADVLSKGPWVDVRAFGASGSAQQTTGSITSGSTTLTLTNALDFQNGYGIRIDGAGTSGADLIAVVSSGGGTTSLTLDTAASTTVTDATVDHDDHSAIQAAYDYAYSNGMLSVYLPGGTYRLNSNQLKFYCNSDLAAPEVHGAGPFATKLVWTGSTACIVNGDASTYVNKPQVGCWGGFHIDATDATCTYVVDLYQGCTQWEFNKIRVTVPDAGVAWFLRGDHSGIGLASQFNNFWFMCDVQVGTGTGLYGWRLGDTADVANGRCNGNRFMGCRVGNNFKAAWLILGHGNDIDHCTVNPSTVATAVCKGINNRFSGGYFDGTPPAILSFRDSDSQYRAAVQVVQVNGLDYFAYSSPHGVASRVHEYSHGSYAAAFTPSTCTFDSGSATTAEGAVNCLGGRGSTMQFANPNSTYYHYLAAHAGTHIRSHMGSAMTDPADLATYANIQLQCEDNTALTGIIGTQNAAAGKWTGLVFSRQGYSEGENAVSDDGGTSVVINDGTSAEFRVVTTANGSAFTSLLEVGAGGANAGLRTGLRSTSQTMTGNETFTSSDGHIHVRDAGGSARNFNPSGDFDNGHLIILLNVGGETITFDSGTLADACAAGERAIYVYRGSWYLVLRA